MAAYTAIPWWFRPQSAAGHWGRGVHQRHSCLVSLIYGAYLLCTLGACWLSTLCSQSVLLDTRPGKLGPHVTLAQQGASTCRPRIVRNREVSSLKTDPPNRYDRIACLVTVRNKPRHAVSVGSPSPLEETAMRRRG